MPLVALALVVLTLNNNGRNRDSIGSQGGGGERNHVRINCSEGVKHPDAYQRTPSYVHG